jgi:hypothetical protein
LSQQLALGANNCDKFGVAATRHPKLSQQLALGANNCDKFGFGPGLSRAWG